MDFSNHLGWHSNLVGEPTSTSFTFIIAIFEVKPSDE